jgi:hypothetical protein
MAMEQVQLDCRARVWNRGTKIHREMFKGEKIEIPGGEFVEMDYYDAVAFKGQFVPVVVNDLGQHITEKRIEIEKIPESIRERTTGYVNPINGRVFASEQEAKDEMHKTKEGFIQVKEAESEAFTGIQSTLVKVTGVLENLSSRLDSLESKTEKPRSRSSKKGALDDANGDHRSG